MDTTETTLYTAIVITSVVLGLIIGYFILTMFRHHRRHFAQLQKDFRFEVKLLEDERTRIAQDLHDELGPLLALTHIHLQQMSGMHLPAMQHHATAIKNIEQLTKRMGEIARNLTPKVLKRKGLKVALEASVEQYNEQQQLHISLTYRLQTELPVDFALTVYRIAQELLHNAHKHSEASTVQLKLAERKQLLYLYYKDDGKGLPAVLQEQGMGIGNINSRITMLGGKVHCRSAAMQGTSYFIELPLPLNERL